MIGAFSCESVELSQSTNKVTVNVLSSVDATISSVSLEDSEGTTIHCAPSTTYSSSQYETVKPDDKLSFEFECADSIKDDKKYEGTVIITYSNTKSGIEKINEGYIKNIQVSD